MKSSALAALLVVFSGSVSSVSAQDSLGEPGRGDRGPNELRNVYFGEQHLHTANSPDAFVVNGRQTWDQAYEWAMGKEVTLGSSGQKIKKSTPYDFVGITDHAEYFGVMPRMIDPNDPLYKTDLAKKLRDPNASMTDPESAINIILRSIITNTGLQEFLDPELVKENWANYVETANKYNKPGEFTTLIGYEWTSIPGGRNMHRNVYFKDQAPMAPFSAFQSIQPGDLWTYMESLRSFGVDNLAIPHNANVSDGWMFSERKFMSYEAIDARHAARQAANEPVMEIIQTKGSSDTHPTLSPNDEFADFELFPNMINVGQPSRIHGGYMRQGLVQGMILEDRLGANPFKYGIVSGADAHSGYSNNEEFNFHGSHGALDDTPEKRLNPAPQPSGDANPVVASAGATAVWAEENTREAIFEAIKRKETYGTSGPLMRLRFFGGWDYSGKLIEKKDFVEQAYEDGVPMGGDLPAKPSKAKAPTFAVWALKDPESGNLDRIQIIKGTINKWGRPSEQIYNVAVSDNRKPDADGKVPPVGNTVDIEKATYTNDIGDTQLAAVWTDPDFDPAQRAVYYVRVLEIPTPRWTTYDSARNNLPLSEIVPATIQERAWSSPIWYTPAN